MPLKRLSLWNENQAKENWGKKLLNFHYKPSSIN